MTIAEIKTQLTRFRFNQCGMYHEKVAIDEQTQLPITRQEGGEQIFQRVKLCREEERNFTLGCAHTRANDDFKKLVSQLPNNDPIIQHTLVQFDNLIVKIYQLDWRRGDLEKAYAENLSNPEQLAFIQKEIDEIKISHHTLINELQALHANLIAYLDKVEGV